MSVRPLNDGGSTPPLTFVNARLRALPKRLSMPSGPLSLRFNLLRVAESPDGHGWS